MQVSVSGYYYWLKHPVSCRTSKEQELLVKIRKIYDNSKKRYGSPRIASELREQGIRAPRPRVARRTQMPCRRSTQKANIKSIIRKKYRVQTTDSNHEYTIADNHLNRDFSAIAIGQKWVSDLTYIKTGEGWLYKYSFFVLLHKKGAVDYTSLSLLVNNRPFVWLAGRLVAIIYSLCSFTSQGFSYLFSV